MDVEKLIARTLSRALTQQAMQIFTTEKRQKTNWFKIFLDNLMVEKQKERSLLMNLLIIIQI